jgi:S1-C subfamily serine protease
MRALGILFGVLALSLAVPAPADAQQQQPSFGPEILESIVKVTARVPSDARTARSLSTERESSGVVIDGDGLVLTIGYGILEADDVQVETAGGKAFPATIVAYDHDTGFGLLKAARPLGVKPMEMGTSAGLEQKQPVLVAGHGGPAQAMGAFVVDLREFAGYWEYLLDVAIFTSPPYGNFGGAALIDPTGKLVGIGSLIVPDALQEEDRVYPGNMFIPIDALKPILADLIAKGKSDRNRRPWLGIAAQEIQGRLFVARVQENSPGWNAGVRQGDMLLGVDGVPVSGLADYYRKVWALGDPGVDVPLLVLRGNEPTKFDVKSIDRYDWLKLKPTY